MKTAKDENGIRRFFESERLVLSVSVRLPGEESDAIVSASFGQDQRVRLGPCVRVKT